LGPTDGIRCIHVMACPPPVPIPARHPLGHPSRLWLLRPLVSHLFCISQSASFRPVFESISSNSDGGDMLAVSEILPSRGWTAQAWKRPFIHDSSPEIDTAKLRSSHASPVKVASQSQASTTVTAESWVKVRL